jgi:FMN phosphatase YigB (HAD superfamily)
MNKALLLDVDGVLLTAPQTNQIISTKAVKYVQKILDLPIKEATIINKYLYTTFGHTSNGLKKLGYYSTFKMYNDFVYNDLEYDNIFKDIKNTNKSDIKKIHDLQNMCESKNIKCMILSNSPKIWYETAFKYMNIDISSFEIIDMNDTIKPDPELYTSIEKKYKNTIFYFVDDSFTNFTHTLTNNKWLNIMFDKNFEKPLIVHKNFCIINDIDNIKDIILFNRIFEDNVWW